MAWEKLGNWREMSRIRAKPCHETFIFSCGVSGMEQCVAGVWELLSVTDHEPMQFWQMSKMRSRKAT